MKNSLRNQSVTTAKIVILALVIGLGTNYLFADWTAPTQAPPAGNVALPVNASSAPQYKAGPLSLDTSNLPASNYGLDVESNTLVSGSLVANSVSSNGLLLPTGAASGDVLTSDASGNATWKSPSSVPSIDTFGVTSTPAHPGLYYTLMQDATFISWFNTFTNGTTITGNSSYSPLPFHAQVEFLSVSSNQNGNPANEDTTPYGMTTAAKLCEYFTGVDDLVTYTSVNTGNGTGNSWIFWNPAGSSNSPASSWGVDTTGGNPNSSDLETITCVAPNGVIRGASYLMQNTIGVYTGRNGTATSSSIFY